MATASGVKKSAGFLFFLLVCAIGALIWLFASGGRMMGKVSCVSDNINFLQNDYPGLFGNLTSDSAGNVGDGIKQWGGLVLMFCIIPGAFIILWLLLVVGCACRTEDGKGYYCAKVFIFLSNIFIILGIVFYSVIAAVKILVEQESVVAQRNALDQNCRVQKDQLQAQIDQCKAEPMCPVDVGPMQEQLNAVDGICTCSVETIDAIGDLFGPAVTCTILLIITFIWVQCLCCHMGCLCKNAGKSPEAIKGDGIQFSRP